MACPSLRHCAQGQVLSLCKYSRFFDTTVIGTTALI